MTLVLLPSAAGLFIAWCKANTDLAAVIGDRVGAKLNKTLPCIRVQRIGGTPDQESWNDRPELQVECWAADDPTAEQLSRQVIAALPTVRGPAAYGRVYTFAVASGPYFAPDDPNLSSNVRYIMTVQLLTTP